MEQLHIYNRSHNQPYCYQNQEQHSLQRLELMAATLGTRLYSFISKLINTDTMFVCGLIARSSFPGSPARRHLSHLLTTVSMKYNWSPHRGNTAHQWITRLIYSPEGLLSNSWVHPFNGDMAQHGWTHHPNNQCGHILNCYLFRPITMRKFRHHQLGHR